MIDASQHLAALQSEGSALRAAVVRAPAVAVEHCPGWDNTALLGHVAGVYRWITAMVTARIQEPTRTAREDPPADRAAVLGWFDESREALTNALRSLDPHEPMWTWTPRRDGGFFHRRMAMETLVHRWDAEHAAGIDGSEPSGDIASDGVDEICAVGMQYSMSRPDRTYPQKSLLLQRCDGPESWLLRGHEGRLEVLYDVAGDARSADLTVRGSAASLLLYLWGRGQTGLEIVGDQALADAWARVAP